MGPYLPHISPASPAHLPYISRASAQVRIEVYKPDEISDDELARSNTIQKSVSSEASGKYLLSTGVLSPEIMPVLYPYIHPPSMETTTQCKTWSGGMSDENAGQVLPRGSSGGVPDHPNTQGQGCRL